MKPTENNQENKEKSLFRAFITPVEEKKAEEKTEYFNEGSASSNKNYVFNNCSITINEEGKAISILEAQETRKAKMQELQMQMIAGVMETVSATIASLLKSKAERVKKGMAENTGTPVPDFKKPAVKRAPAKKKAPVKKASPKKVTKK